MSQSHPMLTETKLKGLNLLNRVTVAPMTRVSAAEDGTPTSMMADYYRRFARGGFSLIITEGAYTDIEYSKSYAYQPGIVSDKHQEGWSETVKAVHGEAGKIVLQLMHAGAMSQYLSETRAPSSLQPKGKMLAGYSEKQGAFLIPKALEVTEIDIIIRGFVESAQRAEKAGFDGIEIHSANGYLLDQFITETSNHRTDHYGGSIENRIRLTAEIIQNVKKSVAKDFIVGVRLSQAKINDHEYYWAGGAAEAAIIFKAVADAGADYIHFASEGKGYRVNSYSNDQVSLPKLARDLTGLPIIANGGLEDLALSEKILQDGHADLIAIGKTALVNYDLPQQLEKGVEPKPFTFDLFKYGVTIAAQYRWEKER